MSSAAGGASTLTTAPAPGGAGAASASATTAGNSNAKMGWLKKRSPGNFLGLALWQSRYVVVDEDTQSLKYYRSLEDSLPGKDDPGARCGVKSTVPRFAGQTR